MSKSLKRSSDVLASDECDIDKLLKHGFLSWSAASRVELQWEVLQTTSFFLSDCDDAEQTSASLPSMFASQEECSWQVADTLIGGLEA